MTQTYQIKVDGTVRMTFSADFAQASCPIRLEGDSTPFQVADARHSADKAAELLIGWCDSQGGSNVADDEEYEVEAVSETAGKVKVGQWGRTNSDQGHIWAAPEDAEAVQAAYDAADEANPDLSEIETAGGVYIRD